MQLVDANTEIFTLKKGISETITYDERAVKERYGLEPEQLIDFKALRGDPSDNIPGVKGIGEKTAAELIKEFGSLEELYKNLDSKKIKDRVRELLQNQEKDAFLSKKLVTIQTDLPTNFKLAETGLTGFNQKKIVELFRKLEFKSLLNKIPSELNGQQPVSGEPGSPLPKTDSGQSQMGFLKIKNEQLKTKFKYALINDKKSFAEFLHLLKKQEEFAIDSETTSLNVWQARLLGLSFSWTPDEAFYLNINDHPEWLDELKPILENPQIKKIGHHLKYDYEMLMQNNINLAGIEFDTLLAAYLLTSANRNLDLDSLVFSYLGYQMQPIEELIGPKGKKQISMAEVPLEKVSWYAGEDADFSLKLYQKLRPELEKISDLGLLKKVELPLIPVLAKMEQAGIKIDTAFLKKLDQKFTKKIKVLEEKIYQLSGRHFNIASPLQLKEVLFEKMGIAIKGLKRTKTGISTAAGELEKLWNAHPIIPLISEFREYSKLQNTYTRALPKEADKSGRIHTSFNQTITATGRLSSSEPNLQNIPIRTEIGKEIRRGFIAERGYRLISADYSQIELRIIASLAEDKKMIEYFKNGEDIHARTAANINKIELKDVTRQQRTAAKEVNFGVIYGLGHVGLSQRTGISREEAKKFIEAYFELYPQIKKWLAETKEQASKRGYVETLLGRRRYLPDINSGVQLIKAGAERMAVNAPIQGTAADLLKMAMVKIDGELPKISPQSKMLLTVHDELVFEAPEKDVAKVSDFVKKTMENIYKLKVPIEAEVKAARNWGECK